MKRKFLVTGILAGGLLVAWAQAVAASGATGSSLVSEGISLMLGQRDFRNYCSACHGIEAKGDVPVDVEIRSEVGVALLEP